MPRPSYRAAGNRRMIAPALWGSPFLRACRGEPGAPTPVWLMRQAGRYLPRYRRIRATRSFLEICRDPSAAAEIAIHARAWLGVDAAIVFSDILLALAALGLPLAYTADDGPVIERPIDSPQGVAALRDAAAAVDELGMVAESVRLTARGLPPRIPLIGFCGGPFTLAAYAIEGGRSRQFVRTKAFMRHEPAAWRDLMARLVAVLVPSLNAQVEAGAVAVQVFDSWLGCLTRADFAEFAAPALRAVVEGVTPGVPVILFGALTGHLIDLIAGSGADVIGCDTTTPLAEAWTRAGGPGAIAVQGNLDPALLLGPRERLLAGADAVLAEAGRRGGHIFNLGHGVPKEAEPDLAKALVEHVHERTVAPL